MDKEMLSALSSLLDEKLNPIKEDVSDLKQDIKYIQIQQEEHGRILKVLEDKAITNKAEHDKVDK